MWLLWANKCALQNGAYWQDSEKQLQVCLEVALHHRFEDLSECTSTVTGPRLQGRTLYLRSRSGHTLRRATRRPTLQITTFLAGLSRHKGLRQLQNTGGHGVLPLSTPFKNQRHDGSFLVRCGWRHLSRAATGQCHGL